MNQLAQAAVLEVAALRMQLQTSGGAIVKTNPTDKISTQPVTLDSIAKTMTQLVQQMQGLQNFQHQLYAELQSHKAYVNEQMNTQQISRKRARSDPDAHMASKIKNGVASDSTDVESVINHGQ